MVSWCIYDKMFFAHVFISLLWDQDPSKLPIDFALWSGEEKKQTKTVVEKWATICLLARLS